MGLEEAVSWNKQAHPKTDDPAEHSHLSSKADMDALLLHRNITIAMKSQT